MSQTWHGTWGKARLPSRTFSLIAGSSVAVVAVGIAASVDPIVAVVLAIALLLASVFAIAGFSGIALVLAGSLPWFVVLSDVLPRLVVTFAAAATAGAILIVAAPRLDHSRSAFALRVGVLMFSAPVLISMLRQGFWSPGVIQAAKFAVFPAVIIAVCFATNHAGMSLLRTVALASSSVALAFNLLLGLSGIANVSYYQSGDVLGLGSEHTLALLGGSVAAAGLVSISTSIYWAPAIAVGVVATVATGVRSALPGLLLAVLVRLAYGRVRLRVILLMGLAVVAVFLSGAQKVVEARFQHAQATGEYSSFSSFGSGRGSIYEAAVGAWWNGSPLDWLLGTGLRTIPALVQAALGDPLVGHSDLVEVGVQLGVVGLAGFLLMWAVLVAKAGSKLPLLVIGSMAAFNGALEYNGALVLALLFTVGFSLPSRAETIIPRQAVGLGAVKRLLPRHLHETSWQSHSSGGPRWRDDGSS